jgi:uncharacterized glyoxalase superfamily protein PhnB
VTLTPRFDAIGLVVADMAAALAFYRHVGLDIPTEADDAPHAEATLPGGLRLMFDTIATVHSFDPEWSAPSGGHRVALAFACDTPDEVDAAHAAAVTAGYRSHVDPWDAFWGQRYATILDPDDNPVDFFAPLPVAQAD